MGRHDDTPALGGCFEHVEVVLSGAAGADVLVPVGVVAGVSSAQAGAAEGADGDGVTGAGGSATARSAAFAAQS